MRKRNGPHFLLMLAAVTIVAAVADPRNGHAQNDPRLSQRQSGLAQRYQKLEELLLRLADVEAAENPERSALLRRAARQSRDKFVLERLRTASEALRTQEFQKAVDNQKAAETELASLLRLLMSEDRSKRIRDEKERLSKLIKDLKRNLNNQRSARARTENGADIDKVTKEQQQVTRRSEELRSRLSDENDADAERAEAANPSEKSSDDSEDKESGESEESEKQDGAEQKGEEEERSGNEKDQDDKAGEDRSDKEGSPSEPSPPSDSRNDQSQQDGSPQQQPPSPGQPQQNQSQPSEPQQPATPEQQVEQRLQQAIEKMREAEQELEKAKREEATQKQREAEENLRAAIDRLERILRQLREEELQRELARLEARLKRMAAMQTKVLDDTVALAATPLSQRDRQTDLKSGDLAFEEKKITLEADRAMLLLREEGSSVAFPEVVSQIRSDTVRVAELLGRTRIGAVAQGIQQDILAALEEMIQALQKAQRDLEKQRQQQQQGQSRQAGQREQPLVESLAELKLLRTMETRIKSTTDRYSTLLESGDSSLDEIEPLLRDLSERQNRLYQITRDLVLKRNR